MTTQDDLLDHRTVIPYLESRGWDVVDASSEQLAGGVSNVVLKVTGPALPGAGVVVKQALGRLTVADEWYADRGRAHTEAQALQLLGATDAEHVPRVLDDDPASFALTIGAAPERWVTWKQELMTGVVRGSTAAQLGSLLAAWHSSTASTPETAWDPALEGATAFMQLRGDPYFTVTAGRLPELEKVILRTLDEVHKRRQCLVLGDFSPKNILVDPDPSSAALWVIDLEVAHRGDPAFDVAFLCTHLLLKALHLEQSRTELYQARDAFLASYGKGPGSDDEHLRALVACLLLARVRGSSPAEYLTDGEKAVVLFRASRLLATPGDRGWAEELWS